MTDAKSSPGFPRSFPPAVSTPWEKAVNPLREDDLAWMRWMQRNLQDALKRIAQLEGA